MGTRPIFFDTEVSFEDNDDFTRSVVVGEDGAFATLTIPRDVRGRLVLKMTPGQLDMLRAALTVQLAKSLGG